MSVSAVHAAYLQRLSRRLPRRLQANALQRCVAQQGSPSTYDDLMQSNPQRLGLQSAAVHGLLGESGAPTGDISCGWASTRQHLSTYLQAHGHSVTAAQLVCTASTSEAYALLFKLWGNAGEAVAISQPAYPLIAQLAALEGLRCVPFAWHFTGSRPFAWELEEASLERALQAGVKLVVLVSPNNPTGNSLHAAAAQRLATLLRRYPGVAVCIDEVFAPYTLTAQPRIAALWGAPEATTVPLYFVLDGLSKLAGLPQAKLSWIAVHGEVALVRAMQQRLSFLADAYLSVNGAVQNALPVILAQAPPFQARLRARLQRNVASLQKIVQGLPAADILPYEGGWYAVLRVPQHIPEAQLVIRLLERAQTLLHPGYFYDFARRGYLISGLLAEPVVFAAAWQRCAAVLADLWEN